MASVAAYKAGSAIVQRAPVGVRDRVAAFGGRLAARRAGDAATIIGRNLERAAGHSLSDAEKKAGVDRTFEWYARYYAESFALPTTSVEDIDHGFGYDGVSVIEEHCGEGKSGAILALPHLGTWEWAAFWLAHIPKVKVTAIVEPIDPPEVFEWFVGLRESLGMEIHALGPDAGKAVMSALKQGHLVCLLCDRDLQGNGVPVDFFGERTTLPGGPATIALRAGVPILPSAVYWRDGARHGLAGEPLVIERESKKIRQDVQRVTQMIATRFEGLIRQAPEQWHMLQPNWPSDYVALGKAVPEHLQGLA